MKKLTLPLCLIIFSLILTSCNKKSFDSPTSNIEYLCEKLTDADYNSMLNCFNNSENFKTDIFLDIDNANLLNSVVYDYSISNASKITYEIKPGENENQIIVDFTYVDGSKIINEALSLYLDDVINSLRNNATITPEENLNIFTKYFNESILNYEDEFVTQSVVFNFTENDNNYLIDSFDSAFYDVMYNNIISSYKQYSTSLEIGEPISDEITDEITE